MNQQRIYLDYNATTPVDPQVVEAMMPYWTQMPGNAASRNHPFGWEADETVTQSREQIASLLEVNSDEIVFTSGATEAINLAIKGVFERYQQKGNHLVTVETEHHAVLDTMKYLEKKGAQVTYLKVDANGNIDLQALEAAISDQTILVAVMWANNETGVIQPIEKIGQICKTKGTLFLSDATQAVGKIPVLPRDSNVDMIAFSGHKVYGPKGVGGLYVSRKTPRVQLTPLLHGGGHEHGFRSGTLNVPGIVGMAKAISIAVESLPHEKDRLQKLKDKLESSLAGALESVVINGQQSNRLAHVTNLSFRFVEAEALMNTFNQSIAASTGSACSSATLAPSHVLLAMGISERDAQASVRFSLGRYTTEAEIDMAIDLVVNGVKKMRAESPVWEMFKDGLID